MFKDPTTWRIKEAKCPHCEYKMDACTKAIGDAGGPKPGDLSVCVSCITVNQFLDDGNGDLTIVSFDINELNSEYRKDLQKLRDQLGKLRKLH